MEGSVDSDSAGGCCVQKHSPKKTRRTRHMSINDQCPDDRSGSSYSNLLRLHKQWAWHWSKSRLRRKCYYHHHHHHDHEVSTTMTNKKEEELEDHTTITTTNIDISTSSKSVSEIELDSSSSTSLSPRCFKPADHHHHTADLPLHPDTTQHLYDHQTTLTTTNQNQCLRTTHHQISSNTSSTIRLKEDGRISSSKPTTQKPYSCLPKFKKLFKSLSSSLKANSSNWAVLAELTFLLIILFNVSSTAAGKNGFRCGDKNELPACLPKSYSKFELPNKKSVNRMKVTIDIIEVLRINDKDYSITFACYFNVMWMEKRIQLGPTFGIDQVKEGQNATGNAAIAESLNLEFVKSLWLPNIFIYNLKTYKVIDVLSKLAGLWVYGNNMVLYSQATHITFICPMRFDKFPLDTQVCKFQVGSYSYEDRIMTFETEKAGYSKAKGGNSIALDYEIIINELPEIDTVFSTSDLGNFSLAGFEMVLQRYVSTYIITYYLPSGLFVIVSWISFLIPMDVIPGRMALLVTLFLVLVNIFNTVTTNTPKAEGLTAIEAWMLACILFVFGALIE